VLFDLGYQRTERQPVRNGVTLKLTTSGFSAALGIAWRFSASPRPLE
jgi:hypothetical protein